jgi:serine/threonine protein kinase
MGHSPFKSKKEKNIMIKIKLHDLVFDKDKPLSKDCMNLITGLLDANPLNRLKLKDIFNHPFIISNSKLEHTIINSKRRESLDDSNENILKYFNEKNANFTKDLKKKFGFDSKLSFRDKLSSKQLLIGQFQSDKNLRTVRLKKIEKKESQRLEKLIVNMSNELEKGKKKNR